MNSQQIVDLTVTAVESGSYGSLIYSLSDDFETIVPNDVDVSSPPCASERIGLALLAGQPVTVRAFDDPEMLQIDRAGVEQGAKTCAQHKNMSVEDWFDQHDVVDADAAFQLAAFGELVYG